MNDEKKTDEDENAGAATVEASSGALAADAAATGELATGELATGSTAPAPSDPARDVDAEAVPAVADADGGADASSDAADEESAGGAGADGASGAAEAEAEPGEAAPSERDVARVRALFTRRAAPSRDEGAPVEDAFVFARWTKPIAPVFFGVEPQSVEVLRQGFERAAELTGVGLAETDPELGANVLVFVCEAWGRLKATPSLERLIPDLDKLLTLLAATGANQYRVFRFDEETGVKLAIVLLRMDDELNAAPPATLALSQGFQTLLLWSDSAFSGDPPITVGRHGRGSIKRWASKVVEAAYAEDAPIFTRDPAYAETLAAALTTRARPRRGGRGRRSKPGGARGASAGDGDAAA